MHTKTNVSDSGRLKDRIIRSLLALADGFVPGNVIDPDQQRRARLLVASGLSLFLICLFFGSVMVLLDRYPDSNSLLMFVGCGMALLSLVVLRYTRSIVAGGTLLCLEALTIIIYQAYNDNGLADPTLLWNLIVPWLAAFLIGPSYGFVFAGLVAVVTGGFYLLELSGHQFPNYSRPEEIWLFYFMSSSTVALFVGYLGWLYEGQTLRTLRAANNELQGAHNALQESNRRIEGILESIGDGFFALDHRARFTYINHRAETLLKQDRSELLGRNAMELLEGFLDMKMIEQFRKSAHTGHAFECEILYPPVNRWFEVHVYPLSGGVSVYFSDSTERREYQNRLIEAKDRAEELARLKSTFVTNISHEIRTPLTGILGFASVLAKEVTGDHQEFAQLIEQNGQRLLETLNSVLDLAKLDSGQVDSQIEQVDLVNEAEDSVKLFTSLASDKGLYLYVRRQANDTVAVLDRMFFRQVLNNLIGNAIKFTEKGGIVVEVDNDEKGMLVSVVDTGIGISEDFLPHLFEEFQQESSGLNRSHQGSGLGLAITHRLVEAMGGSIEVTTRKNIGTNFTIRLPRRVEAAFPHQMLG